MPVMIAQFIGKSFPNADVFALNRQQHPLGLQVHKHRQVIVSLLPVHLVGTHPNDIFPAQISPCRIHMGKQCPPQFLVGFPQNLPRLFDRHFPHQRQGKGLKLLGQPPAAPLPRRMHRVNFLAFLTLPAGQRTRNLRLQLARVEMPPPAFRRVIIPAHSLATAIRTAFLLPQGRRFLHSDQHLAF
jgi:hypothetical protein